MSEDGFHPPDAPTGFASVTDAEERSPSWLPWAGLGLVLSFAVIVGLRSLMPAPELEETTVEAAGAEAAGEGTAKIAEEAPAEPAAAQ